MHGSLTLDAVQEENSPNVIRTRTNGSGSPPSGPGKGQGTSQDAATTYVKVGIRARCSCSRDCSTTYLLGRLWWTLPSFLHTVSPRRPKRACDAHVLYVHARRSLSLARLPARKLSMPVPGCVSPPDGQVCSQAAGSEARGPILPMAAVSRSTPVFQRLTTYRLGGDPPVRSKREEPGCLAATKHQMTGT